MNNMEYVEHAGWRRFFTAIYWKIQWARVVNGQPPLTIISTFEIEIDDDAFMRRACDKCGRGKIISSVKFVGCPDYHVDGTRVEYCGFCDIPPVMVLDQTT